MTGLECLREEMRKRGCRKEQVESKGVAVALDIISQSDGVYLKLEEAEMRLKSVQDAVNMYSTREKVLRSSVAEKQQQLAELRDPKKVLEDERMRYISEWNESLKACETAEGRDRMRIAQVFINSVTTETPQNNTAFIYGLALILCGMECVPDIGELKKISTALA